MKKLLFVVAGFIFYLGWAQSQHDDVDLAREFSSYHGEQVILYATEWCTYCAKARQFLAENRIPYFEYDVEKSVEGRAQFDRLGGRGVPLMIVNNQVIKGYSSQLIIQALAAKPSS